MQNTAEFNEALQILQMKTEEFVPTTKAPYWPAQLKDRLSVESLAVLERFKLSPVQRIHAASKRG